MATIYKQNNIFNFHRKSQNSSCMSWYFFKMRTSENPFLLHPYIVVLRCHENFKSLFSTLSIYTSNAHCRNVIIYTLFETRFVMSL